MQLPVPNNTVTNVPLAAGYLKAYAHAQGLLEHAEIEICRARWPITLVTLDVVEAIAARAPDVSGTYLLLYTWNSERSMAIAARAKARLPGLLVLAGGPELQRDNDWLLRHPALPTGGAWRGRADVCRTARIIWSRVAMRQTSTRETRR